MSSSKHIVGKIQKEILKKIARVGSMPLTDLLILKNSGSNYYLKNQLDL